MASVSEFRTGMTIQIDGDPDFYQVIDFQHVNPGNWRAFIRTRLKNLRNGKVFEKTFRTSDKFDEIRLDRREMTFLYKSDDVYYFMDTTSYEQVPIIESLIGDAAKYLKENMICEVTFHGDKPFGTEIPMFVELEITETEPSVRGDTVSNATKAAKLETGAIVQVPLFVNQGEMIKIDTRTNTYLERVK
jgi:elongation factor P